MESQRKRLKLWDLSTPEKARSEFALTVNNNKIKKIRFPHTP